MSKFAKFLSAISCWIGGTLLGFALTIILSGVSPFGVPNGIPPIIFLPGILLFGLPVWLVTFLPPFFLINGDRMFWNPLVAGPFGGFVGFLGLVLLLGGDFSTLVRGPGDERALAWMPIFIGIFTFALGSLFKQSLWKKLYVILKSGN